MAIVRKYIGLTPSPGESILYCVADSIVLSILTESKIVGGNMESILESLMVLIARSHSYILSLNDAYEKNFTDKELHFLVIGLIGIALVLVIFPLFKLLSRNHVLVIVFIYVFSLILVLTFAIEIGQWYSGSGTMDFDDVIFGVMGFLFMFVVFAVVREIILVIWRIVKKITKR